MSKLERLRDRAKALEAKDPRGAIEAWQEVLREQESAGVANPDISLLNRIGELYLRLKDGPRAADNFERAVDRYAEAGFYTNAIAMCNKVLRTAPARQTAYLKLAKLYAARGFVTEAKQNFVEYAARMQRAGKIQQAFAALREVTDLSPAGDDLRAMLEEHMRMYGDAPRRTTAAQGPGGRPTSASAAGAAGGKTAARPPRKSSQLVFLDVDAPPEPKRKPGAPRAAPAEPAPLIEEVLPEPDVPMGIEATSLAAEESPASLEGPLDGLEATHTVLDDAAPAGPSLRQELVADEFEPMVDFEPTAAEAPELVADDVLGGDRDLATPSLAGGVKPPARGAPPPARAGQPPAPRVGPPPAGRRAAPSPPAPAPPPPAPAPPKRKTVVELPPLELEPDFDATIGEAGGTGPLDGLQVGDAGALLFGDVDAAATALTIEELEQRVADDPDNPETHRTLAEALIEAGERDRGIDELDLAAGGLEVAGELEAASTVVDEILRVDPNSVRHRQKQVEFAYKTGDKARLIDAYLELADTLLRTDVADKARAVYQRVAEHDPRNERARAALAMLAPSTEIEARTAPRDARMRVRDEAGPADGFVDLGAMILEEEELARDTRMKVEDEEPTGDEERDFQEMLSRFKQGIDENIDETDFQSHYDLGVAFKEMGLLDEAIAEFQKALRAPEGKLRTSEALGVCFFAKGAYGVAESILRRALDLPASGDQERLGILYWLGRALEEQGKGPAARELYGRVFAVDIRFMDVGERAKALARVK
jgi:tetratricopeptide (TPR) repeat protein